MARKQELSTFYPDCEKCIYGKVVEFNLIDCRRGKTGIHPNCKVWKVPCIFFKSKIYEIMKSSENFKRVIGLHLEKVAKEDQLFSETMKKESKNLDDCVTYILNQVKKSGAVAFTDDEIFGMAVHYYDEDNIKPGEPVQCKVVSNHIPELSEEEKEQARKEAKERMIEQELARRAKKTAKKVEPVVPQQASLF